VAGEIDVPAPGPRDSPGAGALFSPRESPEPDTGSTPGIARR